MSQQRLAISVRNEALQTLRDRHEEEYTAILEDLCIRRGVTPALFHPDGQYGTVLDHLKAILYPGLKHQISPSAIGIHLDLSYKTINRLLKEMHERGDIKLERTGMGKKTRTYARLVK